MARSRRRRSAPSSPAQSREVTLSPRQTRQSNRSVSREQQQVSTRTAKPHQEILETVAEQDDTITVAVRRGQNTTRDATHGNASLASVASNDDSVESADTIDLDLDLIVDNIEAVGQAAQNVLTLLGSQAPAQIIKEVQNAGSKPAKRLSNSLRRLQRDVEPYGRGSKLFLRVDQILQSLADQRLPIMGSECVLMRVNLAFFVTTLVAGNIAGFENRISTLLEFSSMPHAFPQQFIETGNDVLQSDSHFLSRTIALTVDLLTQRFIDVAEEGRNHDDFVPGDFLRSLFSNEDNSAQAILDNIEDAIDAKKTDTSLQKRMRQIEKYVAKDGQSVNTQGLRKKFGWDSFLQHVLEWTSTRNRQLDEFIAQYGGLSGIHTALESGPVPATPETASRRRSSLRAREEVSLEASTAWLRKAEEELDALDEPSQSEPESATPTQEEPEIPPSAGPARKAPVTGEQQRQEISESPQTDDRNGRILQVRHQQEEVSAFEDHADAGDVGEAQPERSEWPIRPTQETLDVLSITQRQQKEGDKENRPPQPRYKLTDRQPNATRVTFDDESQPTARGKGKRRRDDTDVSGEDDDFESDTRHGKRLRPYKGKEPIPNRERVEPSRSPLFYGADEEEDEASEVQRAASAGPSSAMRRVPQSSGAGRPTSSAPARQRTADADERPSSTLDLDQIKADGKRNVQMATLMATSNSAANAFRSAQVRNPWSVEETNRLVNLMAEYGTSWAAISKADAMLEDPALLNRTQVQLKDKAMSLKVELLRAGRTLPECFIEVTMRQADIEMLRRLGLDLP